MALTLLAGCGFRPLHAPAEHGTGDPALASIQVAQIPERLGQLLTIALRDSFNPGRERVDPRYTLFVTLATYRRETALRLDATATRAQIDLYANFQLVDAGSRRPVLTGTARSFGAVDLVENEYANLVSAEDAQVRAVQEIATEIQTRLAAFLQRPSTASK